MSEPGASHLLVPCPCCSVCCVPRLAPFPLLFLPLRLSARPSSASPVFSAVRLSARLLVPRSAPPRAPAAGRPPALRLVACGQLAGWCAARPFALPRSRLSASRLVLSACSAICPPLLARSMMLPCLLRILPFSSNSGFSLLFFRLRRACCWLWFGCVGGSPGGSVLGAGVFF